MSKPIIFKTELVPPILNTKLDTYPPEPIDPSLPCKGVTRRVHPKLRYAVGDVCWCKENVHADGYPVDGWLPTAMFQDDTVAMKNGWIWNRSGLAARFMPKRFARIWLRVVEANMEPLQDITEEEARREGIDFVGGAASISPYRNYLIEKKGEMKLHCSSPIRSFQTLWDSINAKRGYAWDTNPTVARYAFVRIEKPEGE